MGMLHIPRPIGTLKFLLAWLIPWRPAFLVSAEPSKLKFFVYHRDMLARHVAKYGHYEPDLTAWIAQHLQRPSRGIVVDVGANLGWHAIHAAVQDAVETVVAFEPDAFNAWLLDRNLSINHIDNVIVNKCVVGAQRGVVRLYRYKGSNLGRHSVVHDYGFGARSVPMFDLDTALDGLGVANRRVLLLKIDVEGSEPSVIAGAARTLAQTDAVVLEYSPDLYRAAGTPVQPMIDLMYSGGFAPHRVETGGRLVPISVDDLSSLQWQVDLVWLKIRGR
jgi:FkbM family methyltransferase